MQQYITLFAVNPTLVKDLSSENPLTIEQIYQFVLQAPEGFQVYRTIRPYSSIDVAQIVESAATSQITVIQLPSDDPFTLQLQVQNGFMVHV